MKRYDLELTATGPVMEERQEGAFVPFSEVSGLAEQLADATRQCGVMADLLREVTRTVPAIGVAIDDLPVVDAFLERIEAVLAGKQQNKPVTITETIRTAPERIWLQVGDQSHYHSEPFPEHHDEVTWCADSVVACEVPYVRADLAGKVPTSVAPDGWKLVPDHLTPEMWDAMSSCHQSPECQWVAALSVAPNHQGGEPCAIEPRSSSPA